MLQLEFFKKYLKPIVFSISAVLVLYILFLIFRKAGKAVNNVVDVVKDKAVDVVITQQTGLPADVIAAIRKDAHQLVFELNTLKGMGFFDKAKNIHLQFDSDTLKCFKHVTSAAGMLLFKNFYENDFTDNNTLITDLTATLSSSSLSALKFVEKLY
jgi:hypothetical protein